MAKSMLIKRLAALGSRISKTKSLLANKSKAPFQRGVMQREVGKNVYKNTLLPSKFDRTMSETKYKIGQHIKKRKGSYAIGAAAGGAVAGGLKYQKVRRSRNKEKY